MPTKYNWSAESGFAERFAKQRLAEEARTALGDTDISHSAAIDAALTEVIVGNIGAGSVVNAEVVAARNGQASLSAKLTQMDGVSAGINGEVQGARGSTASLSARLTQYPADGAVVPGGGRTVTALKQYLANNAVFNVKDYGAACDGVADDTTAIRAALAAVPAQGGTLFFPGISRTTAIVDARDRPNIAFAGWNRERCGIYIDVTDTTTPCVAVGQTVSQNGTHTVFDVEFRRLHFANANNPKKGVGVAVYDAIRTRFTDCAFDFLYDGIQLVAGRWFNQVILNGSRIQNCGNVGLRSDGDATTRKVFNVRVLDSKIEFNDSHGVVFQYGSDLYISDGSNVGSNGGDGVRIIGSASLYCQSCRLNHADIDANGGHNVNMQFAEWSNLVDVWSSGAGGQGRDRATVPEGAIQTKTGVYLKNVRYSKVVAVESTWNPVAGIECEDCFGVDLIGCFASQNGKMTAGVSVGGKGFYVHGPNASFVKLIACDASNGNQYHEQDRGFLFAADCPNDIIVEGCSAFNNAVHDVDNVAGDRVRFGSNDFGDNVNAAFVHSVPSGHVFYDSLTGPHKVTYASAAPTTGTWVAGDVVVNTAPAELGTAGSKYVIEGWVCVTAGTPGTWLQRRALTGN